MMFVFGAVPNADWAFYPDRQRSLAQQTKVNFACFATKAMVHFACYATPLPKTQLTAWLYPTTDYVNRYVHQKGPDTLMARWFMFQTEFPTKSTAGVTINKYPRGVACADNIRVRI